MNCIIKFAIVVSALYIFIEVYHTIRPPDCYNYPGGCLSPLDTMDWVVWVAMFIALQIFLFWWKGKEILKEELKKEKPE